MEGGVALAGDTWGSSQLVLPASRWDPAFPPLRIHPREVAQQGATQLCSPILGRLRHKGRILKDSLASLHLKVVIKKLRNKAACGTVRRSGSVPRNGAG